MDFAKKIGHDHTLTAPFGIAVYIIIAPPATMPESTIIRSQCSVTYMRSGLMHVKTPDDALIALDPALLRHCAASGCLRRAHEASVVRVGPEAIDGGRLLDGTPFFSETWLARQITQASCPGFMLVMKWLAPEEEEDGGNLVGLVCVLLFDTAPSASRVVSIPRTVVRLQRGWRRALEAVRGRRLAVAMALHPRLGGGWLSALDEALVRHIAVEHRILGS